MAQKPKKYADGGQLPAGLQPTMAIGYADGGSLDQGGKGPWTGDLNSNTSTFNQDYLRGANFGAGSSANEISYPQPTAGLSPAASQIGGRTGGANPAYTPPPGELNPDGSTNLDAQGARINSDFEAGLRSPITSTLAGMAVKGLPTPLAIGKGAYDLYQGATGGDFNAAGGSRGLMAGLGTLAGPNKGFMSPAEYALGHAGNAALGQQDGSQVPVEDRVVGQGTQATDVTQGATATPVLDPNIVTTDLAPQQSGGGSSWRSAPGVGGAGDNAGTSYNGSSINSYSTSNTATAADGGMAVTGGFNRAGQANAMPSTPGLQMPGQQAPAAGSDPMHPAIANLHVQNRLADPQVMQTLKAHLDQAIQAGQLNPQQLQMMGQLAQSAIQHPELWPKLRQFAIQAGLPDAKQLPMQFNQAICMALMAASHASQHGDRPGAFANGGMLHGPGTGTSDSIHAHNTSTGQPVKLSNGEYIIPADVVATKGKEFFDNIVRKYHTPAAMQHGR